MSIVRDLGFPVVSLAKARVSPDAGPCRGSQVL